jgi:hypothetical protein
MMQIIEKNEGPKIAYEENGTMVFLGDYELMVNISKYQRDWPVHIDICSNRDNQLVVGTGEGLYYVAQFDVRQQNTTNRKQKRRRQSRSQST